MRALVSGTTARGNDLRVGPGECGAAGGCRRCVPFSGNCGSEMDEPSIVYTLGLGALRRAGVTASRAKRCDMFFLSRLADRRLSLREEPA